MKIKNILALLLVCVMMVSLAACGNKNDTPAGGTTPSSTTTATPAETTAAPAETTTAAKDETTVAIDPPIPETTSQPDDPKPAETTAPDASGIVKVDFSDLSDAEKAALLAVMPDTLPDGSTYEILCRTMCFDNGDEDYMITGNSAGGVEYVDVDNGAIYGKAIRMVAKADTKDNRAEIEVSPFEDVVLEGARGILFYVDFSAVEINLDKEMCASVTMNTNNVRSNIADNGSVGYYYENGTWVQTKNINACRFQIPAQFAGWMYVPATSFIPTKDGVIFDTSSGVFPDYFVTSMRCYTDGYVYSADTYIIFDEITFVK